MQTATQQEPAPAAPPPPGVPPEPGARVTVKTAGPDGSTQTLEAPATEQQVFQLRLEREQLSGELASLSMQRRELAQLLRLSENPARRGELEERIAILDKKIVEGEADIAAATQRIASASPELLAAAAVPRDRPDDHFEDGVFAGGFGVLAAAALIAIIYRFRRRRGRGKARSRETPIEDRSRLERLEQGVDAIAIEVERISEGQRFVTKLLAESHGALEAQQRGAQPVRLERADAGST